MSATSRHRSRERYCRVIRKRRYFTFLLAGSGFSTVEEFLTIVVLKRDVPSYLMTLIVLFPAFLTFVYFSGRIIDRWLRNRPYRDAVQFCVYATLGLMIEWFAIGLSPWSNPEAHPLLMAVFQLGMFSFWGTVAFAPTLFIRDDESSVRARRSILRFYVPYFLMVYLVAFTVSEQARFAATIILIIVGYFLVVLRLIGYFRRSSQRPPQEIVTSTG